MQKLLPTLATLGCGVLFTAATAAAADYPVRPVQIVVPYSAGGGTDLSARIMADTLKKYLGKSLVVRNQPGGGGSIGTSAAVHARADGYTLGMGAQGPLAMLPHYGGVDYSLDDVEFIALMGRNLMVVAGCQGAPFDDAEGFVEYTREHPGEVRVGNSGAGGANHIAIEGFGNAADLDFNSMPFGGASAAVTACVGGHIDAVVASPAEVLPQIQSGSINALLVMEDERIDVLPDTPVPEELGIDFTWSSWKGVIAPVGLPDDVKETLSEALRQTFEDEEFLARMEEMGEFVDYRSADDFRELAERDSATAEEIIRQLGMYGVNQ
ncbi:Bug family tripartite tricarboxylate transporter substrate binding protein [Vreelandella malpeensis]|uniref:Tripartite tricarboxylate transporter substrate binding protein n=1 Tax=Vreelandella malpeensis TaxID=1172368 RepID=A0ABS8DSC8_9GAMM|nr:tripartite tricarboxylate transporter substrate binding protein [Halomonas malpeensis]MCB8889222.1 tripartite tricarboxylate transporter substrate binding protein [Halomonas malpeensis]